MRQSAMLAALLCVLLVASRSCVDVAAAAEEEVVEEEYNYAADDAGAGGRVGLEEGDVVVLGAENFTEFVKSKEFVLVEFYAPWCGHCQSLAPEYAKAATELKADGAVVLAKVDATQHNEIAQEYKVEGYPTLFFFVGGEHTPYTGGRSSDEIVAWVKRKSGPAVSIIKSTSEVEELLDSETPLAVAYLDSLQGKDVEEYIAAARQEDGVLFYMTDNAEIARKCGLDKKTPALVLLKKQNEKMTTFDGSFERKALGEFVLENKHPIVIIFSHETAADIFQSAISKQVLLFAYPEEFEKIRENYEVAAQAFKGKLIFVLVDLSNGAVAAPVLNFFALQADKTRLMGFVAEGTGAKFAYDGDYSADSLKKFSEKFLADELKPFLKSQPAPDKNDEDVKVVVGENFDELVLDESKDVLLEVYAPWCGHCKNLEPEYNKLAAVLSNVDSIVVAKMDGTKNEHPRIQIQGYPTLLFFPAGKKTEGPITADTERTASDLLKFLKSNAAIPFETPVVSEELGSPSNGEDAGTQDELKDEL